VNVAIHDSVASISKIYRPHNYSVDDAPSTASLEAAVNQAAFSTMSYLFPNMTNVLSELYVNTTDSLGTTNQTVIDGHLVGVRVAAAVIADRRQDGTQTYTPYPGSDAPGRWRPTPPNYAPAENPQYGTQKAWCLSSDVEFRPPPPPDIGT
jgi:hypothetical protein